MARRSLKIFIDGAYSWHYSQLVKGKRTGRDFKFSTYITRCLDEVVLDRAIKKAYDLCIAFVNELDEEGILVRRYKIVELIKEWILLNEDRNRAGRMSLSTVIAKVSSLKNV